LTVIELAGLGPAPFAAMLLADLGADVVRVDRPVTSSRYDHRKELISRGRRSIAVDLRNPDGVETVLRLVDRADVLLEPFRPGVVERLGLGPDRCLARNPKLVYGRMTGWGREGSLAATAGHDIGYIATTGVLDACRRPGERPSVPLNLVGDYGGGGLMLALGVMSAVWEATRSGVGQVVDTAMVDGVAVLSTLMYAEIAQGRWDADGHNFLQGAAPWYTTYRTADDRWVAVGSLEGRFYDELLKLLGLDAEDLPSRWDKAAWPELERRFAGVFASRTRDEWARAFADSDACGAPVLTFAEAPYHPHHAARGTYVEHDGVLQPAPAPRFSRTSARLDRPPPVPGEHAAQVLAAWEFDDAEIQRLLTSGVVSGVVARPEDVTA
jgi:alpha-methylacyl-CoA racemase